MKEFNKSRRFNQIVLFITKNRIYSIKLNFNIADNKEISKSNGKTTIVVWY